MDDVSNNAAVPEQSADRIGDRSFSGESLATHIGTTAYGSDAILTPPLANKGEASLESDARIQPVFALKAARTSLSPAIAFTMQQELTPIGSDVAKNAAVAERSARRIDDQPYASEPLVGHSERSAVGAGAMTTLPHANESKASLMPDAPSSPVPPLDEANPPLPSAIAFITQPAPVSSVGDGSNNAAVPERNVTRTSIAAPGASLGDAEVAGQIGGQAIPRERLGAPVVASIAGADAIATSSGRWSRSDGGSMPQVGSASAPGDAVGAALTSQTLIVEHRFVQMSGVQPRVGIDLPNVPATAPVAVPFSGVSGTAVATPVAETATGEAPLAPAQVTAIGTPVRLAGDVIVSKIGQPTLSPVAPAAIEAPMVVGERVSAAASIVNIDLRPRSGFLPAGVLATGTQVEPRARGAAAPAALVFADAIHHALGERDSRGATDPATALTPVAPALPGVAATGAAQGTLDMRHEHWPAAMIERIVSLRDMAAENDTRLRLSPDMLGTIDVSLRRDGDQVQVQITAEQAQTRQLLADAQPRLAELADARGVKLHLTGGQAGGGGQSGGDASRHHPSPPSSTRRDTAAHDDAGSTERRIA
ncbi:flagellar hook-length control protein FliK [Sphingomonas sp. HHU CXW]|uniref:Flagellar hook-length control protein FliK n=1 Tax=Sphingomonas hominis TaxID=2741495 RepID=A0ABX2JHZ5_9SPHN|nr:flagellar hook-length control protein FliK [Sphingomonas hominis]